MTEYDVTGAGTAITVDAAGTAIDVQGAGTAVELEVAAGLTTAAAAALVGGILSAPGAAWTETEAPLLDIFAGGTPLDLGTGGYSLIRWKYVPRTQLVVAHIYAKVAADAAAAAGPLVIIPLGALSLPGPVMPPAAGHAVPGGFGYFSSPVGEGAFTLAAGPAITDLDGVNDPANASILFMSTTAFTGQSTGLEPLVGPGNPEAWTGRTVTYQGALVYEVAV